MRVWRLTSNEWGVMGSHEKNRPPRDRISHMSNNKFLDDHITQAVTVELYVQQTWWCNEKATTPDYINDSVEIQAFVRRSMCVVGLHVNITDVNVVWIK